MVARLVHSLGVSGGSPFERNKRPRYFTKMAFHVSGQPRHGFRAGSQISASRVQLQVLPASSTTVAGNFQTNSPSQESTGVCRVMRSSCASSPQDVFIIGRGSFRHIHLINGPKDRNTLTMKPSYGHSFHRRTKTNTDTLGGSDDEAIAKKTHHNILQTEQRTRQSNSTVQSNDAQAESEFESLDPRQSKDEKTIVARRDCDKVLRHRQSRKTQTQATEHVHIQGQLQEQTEQADLGVTVSEPVRSSATRSASRYNYDWQEWGQFFRDTGDSGVHLFPGSLWNQLANIAYVPPDKHGARSSLEAPPEYINGRYTLPNRIKVRKRNLWAEDVTEDSDVDADIGLFKTQSLSHLDLEERVLFKRQPAIAGYGHAIIDSDTEDLDDATEYAGPLTVIICKKLRVPKAFLLPSRFRHMVKAGSQWLGECSVDKDERAKISRLLILPAEVRAVVFKWLFMEAEIVNPQSEVGQREGYEGWVIRDKGKVDDLVSILNTCNTFYEEGFPLFWKHAATKTPDPSRAMSTMLLPPPHWYSFVQRWTDWPLYLLSDIRYDFLPSLKYLEVAASRLYTKADAVSTDPNAHDLIEHEHAYGRDVLNRVDHDEWIRPLPFDLISWEYLQFHMCKMPRIEFVLKWLLHEPYHGPLQEGKAWESAYATVSSCQTRE